jgi:ribonuclease PH
MIRGDGRSEAQLRPLKIQRGYLKNAHGSALVSWGGTTVLCTAMYETGVPPFLDNAGKGWLTAEYAMLPASTPTRKQRETKRPDGRSTEIGRLIGRCLRCAVDLSLMPGVTIHIDCDVMDADGGTRTAGITGGYVALCECVKRMIKDGAIDASPVVNGIAAVSCGIVDAQCVLDLNYEEDSRAAADVNVVMSHGGGFIEVQGTGERRPIQPEEFGELLGLAAQGIAEIQKIQEAALKE